MKKIIATALLVASGGLLAFQLIQSQPHHKPEVNVNINKKLPKDVQERIFPKWFDQSLFPDPAETLELSEREWKNRLNRTEFRILRSEGTELPFVNEYHTTETEGVYVCRGCSNPLFSSATKFRSSSGWPSFFAPVSLDHIGVKADNSLWMERTEVHCARCGGHLGHVFDDGPRPTGLRYCLNSPALRLIDEPSHKLIAEGREDQLDFALNR